MISQQYVKAIWYFYALYAVVTCVTKCNEIYVTIHQILLPKTRANVVKLCLIINTPYYKIDIALPLKS